MIAELLQHPACAYCTRLSHYRGTDPEGPLRRYFCFGERDEASPVNPRDKHNFCINTPFKGVVQFHVCAADMEWWMAMFLAAWQEMRDKPEIHWPAIEAIAETVKVPRGSK